MRVRHKSGNEEIVRVERKMADTWAKVRGEWRSPASCQACEIMSDSDHNT